jgi:monoamine oxidase
MLSRRAVLAGGSAALLAGAAPRKAWGKTDADVIVIGAGLAGLFAAHRAEVGGLKVIVLEAEPRVGGRLHTLNDLPGRPEAGAIQVGQNYRNVFHIADDLKIPLIAEQQGSSGALFSIRNTTVRPEDWATSPANRLSALERKIAPSGLASFYNAKLPRLETPESWVTAENIAKLDQSYGAKLAELGASDEARRLIAANLNANSLDTLSALHIARSMAIARAGAGPSFTIGGGAQRLPETLARFLTTEVRLNQQVIGIEESKTGVRVTLANGKTLYARDVICTVPFSAMLAVKLSGIDDPLVTRLVGSVPYTMGSFVYLLASDPFWLSDGYPNTLWTDDPLIGRVFVLGTEPPMLKVFATGQTAARIDALAPASAAAMIIAGIESARPSAKGKLKSLRVYSWQKQPSFGGIYHHLSTGIAADLASLAQRTSGRVHFAGEHLALRHSGMEGALESGERIGRMLAARG